MSAWKTIYTFISIGSLGSHPIVSIQDTRFSVQFSRTRLVKRTCKGVLLFKWPSLLDCRDDFFKDVSLFHDFFPSTLCSNPPDWITCWGFWELYCILHIWASSLLSDIFDGSKCESVILVRFMRHEITGTKAWIHMPIFYMSTCCIQDIAVSKVVK